MDIKIQISKKFTLENNNEKSRKKIHVSLNLNDLILNNELINQESDCSEILICEHSTNNTETVDLTLNNAQEDVKNVSIDSSTSEDEDEIENAPNPSKVQPINDNTACNSSIDSDDSDSGSSVDSDIQRAIEKEDTAEYIVLSPRKRKTQCSYEESFIIKAIKRSNNGRVNTKHDAPSNSHDSAATRVKSPGGGGDANALITKNKKKFTLDEDKEILNKVIEILPGKSLANLELTEEVLQPLTVILSRCESSINSRWKFSLRVWLVQYYSKTNKSWKKFTKKASAERRQKVSQFFHNLVKKNNINFEVMNATLKR